VSFFQGIVEKRFSGEAKLFAAGIAVIGGSLPAERLPTMGYVFPAQGSARADMFETLKACYANVLS
jgi:hypothetical protein